jgi:exopolysaccharide/PEP-CTERM locus tyrosine autokinase
MSLIESALKKLRRAGEAGEQHEGVADATDAALPPPASKAISVIVATAPAREVPARHITIDMDRLRNAGYLPQAGLERRFADQYRQIKRPLIEKALAGAPTMRLILISSALPGDGKTFTSLNLAFSIARERDVSVLLVDGDAARAHISEVLGVRAQPGMLDALTDSSIDVLSLITRTDVRGLEILPAGKRAENATELLASNRMAEIAARLCESNARRLVLIDSAPLVVSSEARALLRLPGQIALVVRAGATPKHAILEALSHVDKGKLQGIILNHAPYKGGGYYYYGYDEEPRPGRDGSPEAR